jgi:transcriptional regulator GlxA family with amidase domain
VEGARALLDGSNYGIKEVAARTGFGSADSMRRSFVRQMGVTASEYAERFQIAKPTGAA